MSSLIVIIFRDLSDAEMMLGVADRMRQDGVIDIQDMAIVTKDSRGQIKVRQSIDINPMRVSASGTMLGLLIGVLVGIPVVGAVLGLAGGLLARFVDYDVNREFARQLVSSLTPGTSSVFLLTSGTVSEEILAELRQYGGQVIQSDISDEAEEQFRQAVASDESRSSEPSRGLDIRRLHVIVNPAAGVERPIIRPLNSVFHPAGIEWSISLTSKSGDATRAAQQAAAAGVDAVAVYGGDGTVMEVANGLMGTDIPLALLPGGTANMLSSELGIAYDLVTAAQVITNPESMIRPVDMGSVDAGHTHDRHFILAMSTGFSANAIKATTRDSRHRYGIFAYFFAGISEARNLTYTQYHLVLDGKRVDTEGVACFVANASNIRLGELSPLFTISLSDGLLDVVVFHDVQNLFQPSVWKVQEVTVETDTPQTVEGDGEIWDDTPFTAKVLPRAVRVIVP